MTRTTHLFALLGLAVSGLSFGAEPGFTDLFTGKDLSGWMYGKDALGGQSQTSDQRFFVSGGNLVMAPQDKAGKREPRELISARDINKDFILRLEFKAAEEATGFVTVRRTTIPVADFHRRNEQRFKRFKNDDWNDLEVEVKMVARADQRMARPSDNVEVTYVNGKAVVKVNGTVVDGNPTWIGVEAFPRINGDPMSSGYYGRNLASRGSIGVRTNSGKIEFRNIRFKELP